MATEATDLVIHHPHHKAKPKHKAAKPKHKTTHPPAGTHTFLLNGKRVTVNCAGDVRVLWVLRDLLGVTGPKYGCGLDVCRACTSHINGKAFNPCSVPISQIKSTDHVVTIEGLAASVGKPLHPMQQAWIDYDVAQCGYCQPGQIMTAVEIANLAHAQGRLPNEADLDKIRNICRCGTYFRIREAIMAGAAAMHYPAAKPKAKAKPKTKAKPHHHHH